MTFILKHDLDMVKMYLYTEDEFPVFIEKLQPEQTVRQTDPTEIIAHLHTWMVKSIFCLKS